MLFVSSCEKDNNGSDRVITAMYGIVVECVRQASLSSKRQGGLERRPRCQWTLQDLIRLLVGATKGSLYYYYYGIDSSSSKHKKGCTSGFSFASTHARYALRYCIMALYFSLHTLVKEIVRENVTRFASFFNRV